MDPNACLDEMMSMTFEGDLEGAAQYADDLRTWLAKGGAPPRDWSAVGSLTVCKFVQEMSRRYYEEGWDE